MDSVSPCYDLHSHSLASDGSLTPGALVARAAEAGVGVLALTDHDETAGLPEAAQAARAHAIELVSGVEISVTWRKQTIHVVGLQIDPLQPLLVDGLATLRAFRERRAESIAERLDKAGYPGALEGARRFASGRILSRTHFARFLVEAGHARDMRSVFRHFLTHNRPGHVGGEWASLADALQWIHAAGGLAVIAHPARYRITATRMRELLADFVAHGGEAIEVSSSSHSRDDLFRFAHIAKSYGLYASVGSDFHSPDAPWAQLGRSAPLPDGCRPVWHHPRWRGTMA